ncbi:MAG: hypothetical protein EOP49_34440, partial [Sphingobacteriales bacterium]
MATHKDFTPTDEPQAPGTLGMPSPASFAEEDEDDLLPEIDFHTLFIVIQKSVIWIILLLALCVFASFMFLRYTKEVFESKSIIKIDEKSDAGKLGLSPFDAKPGNLNVSQLSGEIEFIKSNMIFERLVETMPLDISYYQIGNILTNEQYKISPFKVQYEVLNPEIYNIPVNIELESDKRYTLSYAVGGKAFSKEYNYTDVVTTPDFIIKTTPTSFFNKGMFGLPFYFVVNSEKNIKEYVQSNLKAAILNADANTISV